MAKPKCIVLDHLAQLQALCVNSNNWGMFVSIQGCQDRSWREIFRALPWADHQNGKDAGVLKEYAQALTDQSWVMLFKTEKDMRWYYERTVGDDRLTRWNPHKGPARVYAITCSPAGELLNENT